MADLQRIYILACFALYIYSAASASCYNKLSASTFADCQLMDDTYALHWTVNGTTIYLGVEVDGQPGWIGFGLSEAGGMAGADLVTVLKNDQGWTVVDRWSKAFEEPMADAQQDYRLVGDVLQDATSTAYVLQRNITTCDTNDLDVHLGIKQHVVWAYGDAWGYHGSTNRGNNIVTFGTPPASLQGADVANESGIVSLNVSMPNVQIPAQDTTYLCLNFPVPSDRKYHIVEFFMTPATKYVHHAVVYACSGKPQNHTAGQEFDCLAEAKDAQCQAFYAVWAPGVMPFRPPKVAGYPFGKNDYQWFTLEVHYTNPELDPGMTDNSTFHIKYTPNLRQYDMGVLTLGTFDLTIPPGQRNVSISNFCPSACTAKLNQSVTLVHSFYHMHGLGAALVTQHFDGDKELRPLGERTAYNYNYQDPVSIPVDTATLKPGDSLLTTCTFDSRSRANVTTFGVGTVDEMCFNFVAYYPRTPIDFCMGLQGLGPMGFCGSGTALGQLLNAQTDEAFSGLIQQYSSDGTFVPNTPLTQYIPFNQTCSSTLGGGSPPPASSPPVSQLPPPAGMPVSPPPPPTNAAATPGQAAAALLVSSVAAWLLLLS